ncbi:MAG: DUF3024 domain-containing protein [Bradyrhizobium sp.]|uniref:DUF3024 domain-containing protein n=1 Tax=Bradyrhizobium sp. TaxID=376 RepID=UPI0025C2CF3C|nr:DUF3024 domain-containing protein [Bradyrhizobium sp.]MBI5260937.1 DUF3024 domain-containing protein [Bradyrhizobium sp.]
MTAAALGKLVSPLPAHPNELDRRRIERALQSRRRYRYVLPDVVAVADGYRIQSPCCSRNIDADGGVIDIALLHHDRSSCTWQLFRKDHTTNAWELYSMHHRLAELTEELNADPRRVFWQ